MVSSAEAANAFALSEPSERRRIGVRISRASRRTWARPALDLFAHAGVRRASASRSCRTHLAVYGVNAAKVNVKVAEAGSIWHVPTS